MISYVIRMLSTHQVQDPDAAQPRRFAIKNMIAVNTYEEAVELKKLLDKDEWTTTFPATPNRHCEICVRIYMPGGGTQVLPVDGLSSFAQLISKAADEVFTERRRVTLRPPKAVHHVDDADEDAAE